MKTRIVIMIVIVLAMAGCGEEFAAGVATGAAAVAKMNEDAQSRFVEAVNALNDETARINETIDNVSGTVLVKPETLDAIASLKGREKDPVFWTALASVLANVFIGGQAVANRKKS